ncbi:hypothetical protein [uncultured Methylobacterium sp.]|uniref:hypothetical protein n=1 Tax=uncultured Methylobacterium sp. TaxID=157278 RepID=UPI0035C9D3CD
MTADEIDDLNRARAVLARQRNAMTKRLAGIELAPVSMAEDLTRILVAIEAVDRALTAEGRPYLAPDLRTEG